MCFVVFLCANFRLLERMFSRRVASMATAFFIMGPPSLVLWTLSGSAEIVMTWMAGTVFLLAIDAWTRSPERKASRYIAGGAFGFGLWVQHYILYYFVAAAIATAAGPTVLRERLRAIPARLRPVLLTLILVGLLYVVLGGVAFFSTGFSVSVSGMRVTVTEPQKMWWIAGTVGAIAAAIAATAIFRRRLVEPAVGFLVGYAPAIVGRIGNDGIGAPIPHFDVTDLRDVLPEIGTVMLPMLFGWRDPGARPTVLPALVVVVAVIVALSYWTVWRQALPSVFHVLPLIGGVMFLVSGSYVDAQSYRYLMPVYAGAPVIYAIGVDAVYHRSRTGAAAIFVFVVLIFTAQQINWFLRLEPDRQTARTIACLERAGIHTARGPYWRSYSMTFLTNERIIVAPTDGIDRYAAYAQLTRSTPTIEEAGCR